MSNVEFKNAVVITESIVTVDGTGEEKYNITFNGATSGDAVVDAARSVITYQSRHDQQLFQGVYHDLVIDSQGISGVKKEYAHAGKLLVGGTFDGNESTITVSQGEFEISELAAGTDNKPFFNVGMNGTLTFASPNTAGMDFNGAIDAEGTVNVTGQTRFHDNVTVLEGGKLIVTASAAAGSTFAVINNYGDATFRSDKVVITKMSNLGTATIGKGTVQLKDFNNVSDTVHGKTGMLVFDMPFTGTAKDVRQCPSKTLFMDDEI